MSNTAIHWMIRTLILLAVVYGTQASTADEPSAWCWIYCGPSVAAP